MFQSFLRQMRRILAFFLSLSLFALSLALIPPVNLARAQTSAYAEIAAVDAQNFPKISALLDVYDANGGFVSSLHPEDLKAMEDDQPRQVDTLTEDSVPIQLVVAVNPGPGLAVRDANGIPRFTQVVGALSQWVDAQPADLDDDLSSGLVVGFAHYARGRA